MEKVLEVDYLVAGAGPAGASLASFLGQNGEIISLFVSLELED